jgi:LysR family transcriptional regulator for bpeEF and oprC
VALGWPQLQDVVQRRIGAGRFLVAASPDYWARHGVPAHPSELAGHQCLGLRGIDGTLMDMWSFRRDSEQVAVAVQGWLTASNAHRDMVLEQALRGEGVVRLLDWANRDELASGVLVEVLQDWESPEAPAVNLIYRPRMRRVPRARVFIDFISGLFSEIDGARGRHLEPSGRPAWLRRGYGKASDAVPRGMQR